MSPRARAAGLLLAAGAALLQGCATKPAVYGPIGDKQPFGYSDHLNPDGSHTVRVVMPAVAAMDTARAWFDQRAGELCPGGIERTNVFSARRNETSGGYYSPGPSAVPREFTSSELEGYVFCKRVDASAGG